eukprot:5678821-Amphidinium_carterae.2
MRSMKCLREARLECDVLVFVGKTCWETHLVDWRSCLPPNTTTFSSISELHRNFEDTCASVPANIIQSKSWAQALLIGLDDDDDDDDDDKTPNTVNTDTL